MKRLMTVAAMAFVLSAASRPATAVVKPSVPTAICEWCWWCVECWLIPESPSVDYDVQQTFNPF